MADEHIGRMVIFAPAKNQVSGEDSSRQVYIFLLVALLLHREYHMGNG